LAKESRRQNKAAKKSSHKYKISKEPSKQKTSKKSDHHLKSKVEMNEIPTSKAEIDEYFRKRPPHSQEYLPGDKYIVISSRRITDDIVNFVDTGTRPVYPVTVEKVRIPSSIKDYMH